MSEAGLQAALHSCALADRSDLARLRAEGPDFLDLLHRLSTGDVRRLTPGQGAVTVVTTAKGRIVDRLHVHRVREDEVVAVGSRGRGEALLGHFTRFTFAERTGLSDVSGSTAQLVLVGPLAREAAAASGLPVPPPLGAAEAVWRGIAVRVLGEDGTSAEGVSVVADGADLDRARQALAGLPAMDGVDLEAWRIQRGLPGPAEMDEERNPLEAGLWDAVSFTKGCYVGQEVVARLRTYDKVVRTLVTLVLPPRSGVPPRGASLQQGERAVGAITSAVLPPGSASPMAMGFLRREVAATGTPITVVWDGDRVDATVASVSQARAA